MYVGTTCWSQVDCRYKSRVKIRESIRGEAVDSMELTGKSIALFVIIFKRVRHILFISKF